MSKYQENLSADDLFFELEAFSEGRSTWAWRCFGAHPARTEDGTEGYVFRVWAPNAPRITIIGDFNGWDLEATPMEKTAGGMGEWAQAEVIILNRPYGSGAKEAPSFFQERLKIPCRSVDLSRELYLFKGNPDRRIGAFRPLRPAKRRREGAWTAFILCNGLAAVAVSAFFLFQSRKTAADLYRLQMEYTGSKRETEQAAYQAQIAKDLDKCYGKNGTLLRGFSRLQEELGDRGMVTAVRYSRESGILAVRVLTEDPGSMPDMEEGLRAAGDFIQVSHRMWQRDEETGRILGWLELKLWEGAEEYGE